MGGFYPSSRNFHSGFDTPSKQGTFRVPHGIAVAPRLRPDWFVPPVSDGGSPTTFNPDYGRGMPDDPWDVPHGKQPWGRNGRFPSPYVRPKVPFGRRVPWSVGTPFIPSRTLSPWIPAIAGIAGVGAYWYYRPLDYAAALTARGYVKCCGGGGGDAYTHGFLNTNGCAPGSGGLCGTGAQPFQGKWPANIPGNPTPPQNPQLGARLLIGLIDTVGAGAGTRCTWTEQWMKPNNLGAVQPPVITNIKVPLPLMDLPWDPNLYLPLVPYAPAWAYPRPVWAKPPTPETSWPPKTVAGNSPPGSGGSTTAPGSPVARPNPKIEISRTGVRTTSHEPHRHKKRANERKYAQGARGPFGALAVALLASAAKVYNGITETVDLLAAIYSAIPSKIIAQHPDGLSDAQKIPFMLEQIWLNRNVINYEEALLNIAYNQIEDAVWGRYFGAVDKVSRSGTNYTGFDREFGELQELFNSLRYS